MVKLNIFVNTYSFKKIYFCSYNNHADAVCILLISKAIKDVNTDTFHLLFLCRPVDRLFIFLSKSYAKIFYSAW